MKNVNRIYFLLVILLISVVSISCSAASNSVDIKIVYMASFLEKPYQFVPPEEPVKFPVEITSWPGDFHEGPDTIDVFVEVKNGTKEAQKNLVIDAVVELNTGKVIESEDEINEDESRKIAKYSEFITKKIVVKQIAAGRKTKVLIKRISFVKLMNSFLEKDGRIWDCRVVVKGNSRKIIKTLPVGFY